MSAPTIDPASRSASSWSAMHASLKSRGVGDDDPRVIAARAGLAFHRVLRSVERDAGQLSLAGVDRLVAALRQDAAVSR